MFPTVVETERLRLERLHADAVDLLAYYEVCASDPGIEEVTAHLPWSPHDHPKETADYLADTAERWENRESAGYLLRPKSRDAAPDVDPQVLPEDGYGPFAGQAGLGLEWGRQLGSLGMWLRKPFWGRGYSGERAAALFELAFERLDLQAVAVAHDPDNEKSRRAIERYVDRFGGQREGTFRNIAADEDGPVDQVRYTVTREEWAANRPADLEVRFRD